MDIFLFWGILSVIVGVFASSKNRSGFGWFVLSILLSPIITLILVAILPRRGDLNQSLEGKLRELERLKKTRFITEDEYETKRKAILENE